MRRREEVVTNHRASFFLMIFHPLLRIGINHRGRPWRRGAGTAIFRSLAASSSCRSIVPDHGFRSKQL